MGLEFTEESDSKSRTKLTFYKLQSTQGENSTNHIPHGKSRSHYRATFIFTFDGLIMRTKST